MDYVQLVNQHISCVIIRMLVAVKMRSSSYILVVLIVMVTAAAGLVKKARIMGAVQYTVCAVITRPAVRTPEY